MDIFNPMKYFTTPQSINMLKPNTRIRIFILLLVTGIFLPLNAQPWMRVLSEKKATEEPNFYEIQEAFNRYWNEKKIEKGKGYKQFKRLEYFMEPRVFPSGKLPYDIIQDEFLRAIEDYNTPSDFDVSWIFAGPDSVPRDIEDKVSGGIGRLNCITFHPTDPDIIWVGAPTGGAWKSSDGGDSWEPASDMLSAIGISDIAINPLNPDIIYLATGDGDAGSGRAYGIGIMKSTNGGLSWEPTALTKSVSNQVYFRKILIHPTIPSRMVTTASDGIYRTTDGWNTYTRVKTGSFKDLEFNPGNPNILYATSYSYTGDAMVFKSTDGGVSFSESISGMDIAGHVSRIELAVTQANSQVVYALCSDENNDGFYALYKSVNAGSSWNIVYDNTRINLLGSTSEGTDVGGQGWYDLALAVSPVNQNEIYVGGVNVWRSTNSGADWKLVGNWYLIENVAFVHADQHHLVFNPHDGSLYSGNDGGIYKTTNKGLTWTDLSEGLGILQIYRMNSIDHGMTEIIAGTQDNGTELYSGGTWQEVLGGDGMECYFDRDNPDILYGTLYYGDIRKSEGGGQEFSNISPPGSGDGLWITPFIMHPVFPNLLYAGYETLYKTLNGGESWSQLSAFPNDVSLTRVIGITPANDNIIYAITNNHVFRSADAGTSWQDIGNGLPLGAKTALAVSETNPDKVWIALSGYSSGQKIFYSSDGGQAWTNYSTGLPNLPVNCLAYRNGSNKGLFAGNDIGLYYRDASMTQWAKYGNGLPNVIVYDIELLPSVNKIHVATHGRGVWVTDLTGDTASVYTDFKVNPVSSCLNGTVHFTSYSSGVFDSLTWDFGEGADPATATGEGPHNVTYLSLGKKTITLTGHIGSNDYVETKTSMVTVSDAIDIAVTPDIFAQCSSSSQVIYASGGYDYIWSPSDFLDTTRGSRVTAQPEENISYTVTASSGSCTAQKTVQGLVTSNDAVCDAIIIHEGLNGPFSNKCASPQPDEPVPPVGSTGLYGCESQDGWCEGEDRIDNSVWFTFTAPPGGLVSIETDGFDDQIAVYQAQTCNDLLIGNNVLLAANDDYPGKSDYSANIQELTGLTPGNTYWIQVDGSFGGTTGIFTMKLNYFRLSKTENIPSEANPVSFEVVPNPNTGNFTLVYSLKSSGEFTVRLYNINGKLVYAEKCIAGSPRGIQFMDVDLSTGEYILEIITTDSAARKKMFIAR